MSREPIDESLRMDIGRAGGGKSFVRVTDIATGINRTQVGFNGETAESIARRLAAAVLVDIKSGAAPNSSHRIVSDEL